MALRDTNAGFEYDHPDDGGRRVHRLNWPMELVPTDAPTPGRDQFRSQRISLDRSKRETFSVSGGDAETIRAIIRFDGLPSDLLAMLRHAANGTTVDYKPDLDSTVSYALDLIEVGERTEVSGDEDRSDRAEYQVPVIFMSDDNLEPLYSPWEYHYEAGMDF